MPRSSPREYDIVSADRIPIERAIAKPIRTSPRVTMACSNRSGAEFTSATAIAEGGGTNQRGI